TYGYRNPSMKHAVRNRVVQGDRIHHYVGDAVQDLQERNVFDVRIPHAHISTPCNAPLTWGFYCTTSPTLQRCVPTSGENTGAKQGGGVARCVCYAGYNNNGNPLGGCRYLFREVVYYFASKACSMSNN
ncbi:MAG: hypothetical protein IKM35_09760, partial [Bacteroidaceae bacterium]|nr:hypothetical protein [Bacteroidaceae bacterium]